MALGLKVLIQQDVDGGSIWFTDKTGEYDGVSNDTGWGNPNEELLESALLFSVVRNNPAAEEPLTPVGSAVVYDNAAANTDEKTVEFTYYQDGWHTLTYSKLPVSTDAANIVGGGSLVNGDYFYYTVDGKVNQLVTGSPVEITDYTVIDGATTTGLVQIVCEEMFYNKLAIKKNDLYKEYRDIRDKKGDDSRDSLKALHKLMDLSESIRGADYAFRSGLTTEGHDQIETLIARYDIT